MLKELALPRILKKINKVISKASGPDPDLNLPAVLRIRNRNKRFGSGFRSGFEYFRTKKEVVQFVI
jgi:hypothetical protein